MKSPAPDLYNPASVIALFDEMSKTYGTVNLVASLGFTVIWRKACISKIRKDKPTAVIVDLMTGLGELLPVIQGNLKNVEQIKAVDFSPQMCERARKQASLTRISTEIIEADVFDGKIPEECADGVVSSFGLKTFSHVQQSALAQLVARLLKPGGEFSFIEISTPSNKFLKLFYGLYLNFIIPFIGRLFLGNPDNYKFLGIYAGNFKNSRHFHEQLVKNGLDSVYFEHFFGCASGVYGKKP